MSENFSIGFGERLSNLRKSKGLSQKQLADTLGYKQPASVSSIEAGKTPPGINALVKIADIFQVDLHWLITGEHISTQKRLDAHLKDVSKQYSELVQEYNVAQEIVQDFELRKERGEKLTKDEEGRLLENKGRSRSLPKMMEQFLEQQADILKAIQQPDKRL
ncbi:MAG: helix-turn-helix domain-containing protein [Phycisphaerae bacterium]|nr:helix-turn-helix domain-containing protein [Phycisphaerae bacterium]